VSPLAHSAADRLGPLAQSAAERVGPITHEAADRLAPLASTAADRIAPLATQAVDKVSPYVQRATSRVSPYAHQAAERIAPIATSAKQQGARVAQGAVEKFGPVLDEALEKVSPAVEAARGKVSGEILPKLSEALAAAAGAEVVAEASKRGKAVVAAAKGELESPKPKKKGGWLKWLLITAGLAGVAVFVVRKFLGSKDADWQAARPTTPYAPPPERMREPAETAGTPAADAMDDSHEDPQGGLSAHLLNLEADGAAAPDEPAEGGDIENSVQTTVAGETPLEAIPVEEVPAQAAIAEEAPAQATTDAAAAEPAAMSEENPTLLGEAGPEASLSKDQGPKYQGEGVYVGSEPPEGFTIKGNQRSMKYHVPESAGYSRTAAEVWFNSEEAAQQAGFVRAQR
jgi:hypothetical protein